MVLGLLYIYCILYVYPIFVESVVSGTVATGILDFVVTACRLDSIRPGLVQVVKTPNSWPAL